ncbi:phosphate ABC transporter permease subunit PstC [Nocardioides cavernaquae]|uniref:Phosphate transport system permease protein n=1 Tax=Nocardioides cavernaquae TaxID=2321396 RepID=A0A3A5H666_9ACTN|nr:phosphate ABC transporter permease subunit PstC [Nocardioides cavernaquae]
MVTAPNAALGGRRTLASRPVGGDIAFRAIATSSGVAVLLIMTLVGVFLAIRAAQAIEIAGWSFLTTEIWNPGDGKFGIAGVMLGTISVGVIAVLIAFPLAVGAAVFISEYAPSGLERPMITLVDVMAAVPSVIYGLWGFLFLQNHVYTVARWLSTWFGWIPFLDVPGSDPSNPLENITAYKSSIFLAGIVVAFMITPIMCSVMREAFAQAPVGEREAALGLGATRWGMVRAVVFPFGKGAMIGGTMLGLGRALGETIAVLMILNFVIAIQPNILKSGGSTISSLIAKDYAESGALALSALMAAGLALFVVTLVINFAAATVVARSRSGAEST